MAALPQPAPAILELGGDFYDPVEPADFPQTILRFRNDRAAATIGLDGLNDAEWIRHFGRFTPLPDNLPEPLALRYHGHQFRVYNPDIGDGRGFLFAQLRDGDGRLLDLGTKGSGQTPYSRFGDGRLTLKGGVRELLATEMVEALGVDTSRTFSLIETGEPLERGDEPSPTRSAVLVRLQHSHIRIGTFQRLATLGEADNLRKLTAYCLRHYYADDSGDPAMLLGHVTVQAARLAASYIAAGFVHGVLNSDNIAITAQSFDYGPWRWTPYWDGHFTAAYFDHAGLYSFGRQPEAIHWDLVQLARSLREIEEAAPLTAALERFPDLFQHALRDALFARLGLLPGALDEDMKLVVAIEEALARKTVTIDRFFFDWRGGRAPEDGYEGFDDLAALIARRESAPGARDHPYWSDPKPCAMHIDEVEAIWSAIDERDDWAPLHAKIAAIRRMGEALNANA
ncbi:MAG: YdiU family protein [Alphaproteobacteria bacterium]|nr:MAG: YdiU family protein [Alphaproteobacteria bacterium]